MLVFYHSYESQWVAATIEVQIPKANPVVNRRFLSCKSIRYKVHTDWKIRKLQVVPRLSGLEAPGVQSR